MVVSPAYFAGTMQLGGLMQTATAFGSVQGALSFFVSSTVYRQLAEWNAVIRRLAGFELAVEAGRAAAVSPPVIEVVKGAAGAAVEIGDIAVNLPDGKPLVAGDGLSIAARDRVLVTGPSGSGKSTLFRAIAGIWPFGKGRIVVPAGARLMMLPQRPYFPVGTLTAAVSYPAEAGAFGAERIAEALRAVGLPALAGRLDEDAHWNRMLSLGEQQRLGIARALLQAPDYLFLDEATASLDEASEAALYLLLQERLPNTTVVSIGHRSTLMRSTAGACRSSATANGTACGKPRSRPRARAMRKQTGGNLAAAAREETGEGLLDVLVQRQVGRELHNEAGAAPARAEASRVDRGERALEAGVLVAGEGVAITLAQVGVDVAEVERQHLVGEAEADVPGGVVLEVDARAADRAGQAVEVIGRAEPLIAELARRIDRDAVGEGRESVLDRARRIGAARRQNSGSCRSRTR